MAGDVQDQTTLPRHVAVIMDGNGRWAKARGLPRLAGHRAGAESVRATITACRERGIEALTLYSFSTENWARPDEEVSGLMALLAEYLQHELAELLENGVRLRAIGELHRLPEEVQMLLGGVVAATSANTGLQLVLALSYGSRAEIVSAVRDLAGQVHRGELAPDEIDDALISSHLYTADLPDPDLLIRTSGELRLSNFLLWQLAYAELYVTEVPWPDFRDAHLDEALASYGCRQRRFGKTGQQVEGA
jgi:undecaprenyl diphosphate synthase